MRSPDHTRVSALLPPVYQEDVASFAQVDAFLGLADDLDRAMVERLEDLLLVLGPDAVLRWPAELPLDAGEDAVLGSYLSIYDEVAAWMSFAFPASWGQDGPALLLRREFLARSSRLWRRRGTPRGFLSWFSLWFGLAGDHLPVLVEHFRAPGAGVTGEPFTATLFVPAPPFEDWIRRAEADDFVHHYAPAHVAVRVCFVEPATLQGPAFTDPPVLPDDPTDADLEQYAADVAAKQAQLNAVLCSAVSVVDHANAVHLGRCIDEGRPIDRLGVGRLPTT